MAATPTTINKPPRLAVQAFWLTAAKGVAAVLNIFLPVLLVRIMAQTEYGVFKEAFLFVSTATNVATFGVGMSAFYFMPRHPERGGQIALNILVYNFVAGWIPLAAILIYPQILQKLFRTNQLEPLAVLLGFFVLVTLTSSLVMQIPTAMQDVKYSTLFIVGTQVARAIMIAVAALTFRTVKSIVAAAMIAQLLSIILLFWYLDERFPRFWSHFEWNFFKEQLAYALPYGAFGMLWVIQKDLDNYFVSATLGPKDYAIYAVGWVDVPLLTLALESIVSVMILRVSSLQKEHRKKEIREVTANASSRVAAIEFPLFAMLMVGGKDLIVLFYTQTYKQAGSIFLVSILLLPLWALLMDPIVRAYKELRNFLLIVRLVVFAILFSVLLPVIHWKGMFGAAVAAVGAQYLERIIIFFKAARTVEATWSDLRLYRDMFRVAGVSLVAGLAAYFVRNQIPPQMLIPRILVAGIVTAAIYLPAMYFMKLPGWELMSRERLMGMVRSQWGKLRGAAA
jgi:O-antigen/teichoic acid export membrane protein